MDNKAVFSPSAVATSFDRAAAGYNEVAELQRQVGEYLLQRLDWIKPAPHVVVDLGCGTGTLSRHLSLRYPKARVYGFDLARNMVHEAKRQAPRWFSRQYYACAEAASLPLADAGVDLIVSNLMLQWCGDYGAVFAECARVLKPDGVLLFSSLGPETLFELRTSWAAVDDTPHVSDFNDMHDLGDALLQAGLRNPVMDVDRLRRYYPEVKHLMRELKALGAHNLHPARQLGLTGKQRMQGMLAAYDAYREEQGIPATFEVVYGYALGRNLEFTLGAQQTSGLQTVPLENLRKQLKDAI